MLRLSLIVATLAIMMSFALPAVYATQYYGPSFTVPTSIPVGGVINIGIGAVISNTFVSPPAGSNAPCTVGVCSYPLQSCPTTNSFYFSIHEITVKDPNGNNYMLGSATTSGLFWPASLGGSGSGTKFPPQAAALNVTYGDSFTMPFGTGAGGNTFTSVLGNPPNDVSPAGPYYWWTAKPNSFGAGQRLDKTSINPTAIPGKYLVDIEGVAVCGKTPTGTATVHIFFDAGIQISTPEFGAPIAAVAGIGLVMLALMKRGTFGRRIGGFPTTQ